MPGCPPSDIARRGDQLTDMLHDALAPPQLAVICAEPEPTAVTTPPLTLATPGSEVDHVTAPASDGTTVAERVTEPPTSKTALL